MVPSHLLVLYFKLHVTTQRATFHNSPLWSIANAGQLTQTLLVLFLGSSTSGWRHISVFLNKIQVHNMEPWRWSELFQQARACGPGHREGNAAPAGMRRLTIVFSVSLAALFSEKVRNMSPDEIRIPPEPPGRCSSKLQVGTSPLAFWLVTQARTLPGCGFSQLSWFLGNWILVVSLQLF